MANDIVELKYPDGYGQPDDLVGMTRLVVGTQYMGEKYLPADGRTVRRSAYPDLAVGGSIFNIQSATSWTTSNRPGNATAGVYGLNPKTIIRDPKNPQRLIAVSFYYSSAPATVVGISTSNDNGATWTDTATVYTLDHGLWFMSDAIHIGFYNSTYYIILDRGGILYSTDLVTWVKETQASRLFTSLSIYSPVNAFTEFKGKLYTGIYGQITRYQVLDLATKTTSSGSFHTLLGFPNNSVGTNNVGGAGSFFFASATKLYFYEVTTKQILVSTDGVNFTHLATLNDIFINNYDFTRFPTFSAIDNEIFIVTQYGIIRANDDFSVVTRVIDFNANRQSLSYHNKLKLIKHPTTGYYVLLNCVGYGASSTAPLIFKEDFSEFAGSISSSSTFSAFNVQPTYLSSTDFTQILLFDSNAYAKTAVINTDLFGDMVIPNISAPNPNMKYYIRVKR